ncbi:hypothetical protein [Pseudohaliea sp.]|uniref:hypothetical protein n=1 Tax=Pseudohaliea sp. TaxID=2740289 RepID=UPI0032EB6DAB
MSADFHRLAKEAGNRLRGYILAYASGATGVFFLSLSGERGANYEAFEVSCLIFALLMFVTTVAISLLELHIDARRFFYVAKQLEAQEELQQWGPNVRYKRLRVRLIYSSYISVGLGTLAAVSFLVARIT